MPSMVYVSPKMIDDRVEASYYRKQYLDVDEKIVTFNNGFMYLKNLCTKITDGTHKTPDYKPEGIKFITAKNILEDGIDFEDVKYISKDEHNEISKRCKVEPGDMLFTKVGRIGYAKVVPANVPNFSIFVSVALLKLKGNVDSRFIEAFLNSKYGRIQSERLVKGSNQPDFHLEDIAEIKVPIPSPEIQKYIGDKVRKAEELREEAKRLKKEAEEIFFNEINIVSIDNAFKKEQHIKFNWINIDELDVNRIDAEYNRRKYTILVKLLIDNNITLIPISNLLEEPIVSGSTPKGGNYIENGIPFVRATNLCEYSIDDNLVYISKEESDKLKNSEIRSGDVVFSIAGSIGVASIIPSYIEKANINQALVRLRLNNINKYYFVFVVNSSIGRLLSLRLANGAVQLNLNREEVGNIMVPRINDNKEEIIANKIKLYIELLYQSKQLIQEAKQDVEDLIEGNFDMSKVKANN